MALNEKFEAKIIELAIRWWASHRHEGMTLKEHLENPACGLDDDSIAEERLAHAVALYYEMEYGEEVEEGAR